jgi:hypothetical protein
MRETLGKKDKIPTVSALVVPWHRALNRFLLVGVLGAAVVAAATTGAVIPGTATPDPTANWNSGIGEELNGGIFGDAQIAASSTHVVVGQRAALGFYTKDGKQLQLTDGDELFSSLFPPAMPGEVREGLYDLRTIWDEYRQRLVIVGIQGFKTPKFKNPRIYVAYSKGPNPTFPAGAPANSWWLYSFAERFGDPQLASYDYPNIGVDKDVLMIAHTAAYPAATCVTNNDCQGQMCVNGKCPQPIKKALRTIKAADMSQGLSNPPWNIWFWDANVFAHIEPAIHHGQCPTCRNFSVTRHGFNQLRIISVLNPLSSSPTLSEQSVPLPTPGGALVATVPQPGTTRTIEANLNWIDAVVKSNNLYVMYQDSGNFGFGTAAALRVAQVNLTNWNSPTFPKNRVFGGASPEDPTGTAAHYVMGAIEVNASNDIFMVHARTGTNVFPEVRFSAWASNDADIRPSRLLAGSSAALGELTSCGTCVTNNDCQGQMCVNGKCPSCGQCVFWCRGFPVGRYETAGASLDPDGGVWMISQIQDGSKFTDFSLQVSKVGGAVQHRRRNGHRFADFDGDSIADIGLTARSGWTTLPFAFSRAFHFKVTNSSSTFASKASTSGAVVLVGDFDADRRSDYLATGAAAWATPNPSILPLTYSNGDGSFADHQNPAITDFPLFATRTDARKLVGDFDGDGASDITLVGASAWTTVPVAFSNVSRGSSFTPTNNSVGSSWGQKAATTGVFIAADDFDGDGKSDILVTGGNWTVVPIAYSNGRSSFTAPEVVPTGQNWPLFASIAPNKVVGDFNGDGKADVALGGVSSWTSVPVLFSSGRSSLNCTNTAQADFGALSAEAGAKVFSGDFNGDAKEDLAVIGATSRNDRFFLFLSDGVGGFTTVTHIVNDTNLQFADWANNPGVSVFPGDFNGDGRMDIGLSGDSTWTDIRVALSNKPQDNSSQTVEKTMKVRRMALSNANFGSWSSLAPRRVEALP